METLLITTDEIVLYTPMGGNVDTDKYNPCILDVQIMVIEPLLGTELYNKLLTDLAAGPLTGNYKILHESYIKPIMRHQVFAEYVEIGSYNVANAGIYKHAPADSEVVSKGEVQYLSATQRTKAQVYIDRAEKWLKENRLPEYKNNCSGGFNNITQSWWI